MKQFGKILKFELNGYLKNKIFVGVTLVLVVAIAVVMSLPNLIALIKSDSSGSDQAEQMPVMLVKADSDDIAIVTLQLFSNAFTEYEVKLSNASVDEIKADVTSGKADCAFVMNSTQSYTYFVNNLSLYDVNSEIANGVLRDIYRIKLMMQFGLSEDQANAVMNVGVQSNTVTLGKNQADNFLYTYVMVISLYMVIILYGQMVATNVATEKSSRAMELLITSAKPTSMMFGKVIASCIAGFSQLLLIFGSAILFYNLNKGKLSEIPMLGSIFDMPINLFVFMLVFFVLGFLIYAFLFGAIGSTVSKVEDINTTAMPVTFLFAIAFMVVVFSITGGGVDNTLMIVCSYIPFTSPMAMFTRIAMSTVAWYEITTSISLLIASLIAVGVLSARIYRTGVLMYGKPPKFMSIVKSVFKS